jgi:hypothetical protein
MEGGTLKQVENLKLFVKLTAFKDDLPLNCNFFHFEAHLNLIKKF